MNVREYYAYISASREQLWNFVRALPVDDQNRDMIETGERFHNIKDLLLHISDFEDHWIHTIALGRKGSSAAYPHDWVYPRAEQYELNWIIAYGQDVTGRTRAFLDSQPDLGRPIRLVQDDLASDTVTLDQLLWNVMTHEVRHTAQIALLIRQLGHTPPWLDYLRFARPEPSRVTVSQTDTGVGVDGE